jgi:hypothetical protein
MVCEKFLYFYPVTTIGSTDAHSNISFIATICDTQHFSQIQGTQTRRKRSHTPASQQNTYYMNTRPGRTQRNTSVEETQLHTATTSRQNIRARLYTFIFNDSTF